MSGNIITICQTKVSTIYVFDNPQVQTANNTVYEYVKNYSTTNTGNGKGYQFKSDQERLQYVMGLYGRTSEGRR